jgi:DedD protein
MLMDRALKERVTGAVVLVVFAVLVVPVFLDGPSTDAEIITESVTLPGQNDQKRKSQTIVLERDRSEPVPTAATNVTAKETTQSGPEQGQVTVTRAASSPAKSEAKPADTKTPDVSPTGMWAVQLGSFSNQANAERLAADLRKKGYAAFLSQLDTESGKLHRVRIGPQKDRDSAEAIAAKLSSAGHKGQVVTHP